MTLEFKKAENSPLGKQNSAAGVPQKTLLSKSASLGGLSALQGTKEADSVSLKSPLLSKTSKNPGDWLEHMGEKRAWMDGLKNLEFAKDGIQDTYSPQQQAFLEQLNAKLEGSGLSKIRITAATTDKGHSDGLGGEHKTGLGIDVGFQNLSDAQQKQLGGILGRMDSVKTVGTTQHEKAIDEAAGDPSKGRFLKKHSDHFHVVLNGQGETNASRPKQEVEEAGTTLKPVSPVVNSKLEETKKTIMYKALMDLMVRKMKERAAENGNANPELMGMVMDMWLAQYFANLEASGEALPDVANLSDAGTQKLQADATDFVVKGKGASAMVQAALQASGGDVELAKLQAAQAFLETGGGKHMVGNNFFGIKGAGSAGTVNAKSAEFINGQWVQPKSGFRAYNNATESFKDYHSFLANNKRYQGVLAAQTFEQKAQAISKAGYATDPKYAQKLIAVYNTHLKSLFEDTSTLADSGNVKKS